MNWLKTKFVTVEKLIIDLCAGYVMGTIFHYVVFFQLFSDLSNP